MNIGGQFAGMRNVRCSECQRPLRLGEVGMCAGCDESADRQLADLAPSKPIAGNACTRCGHFACVCEIRQKHAPACKFRTAAACPIGLACEHGRDVCPECDPCTCGAATATERSLPVPLRPPERTSES